MKEYNSVLEVNDDEDFCQWCKRSKLVKVVWIENTKTGEIQHFGEICARNLYPNLSSEIDKHIIDFTSTPQFKEEIVVRELNRRKKRKRK